MGRPWASFPFLAFRWEDAGRAFSWGFLPFCFSLQGGLRTMRGRVSPLFQGNPPPKWGGRRSLPPQKKILLSSTRFSEFFLIVNLFPDRRPFPLPAFFRGQKDLNFPLATKADAYALFSFFSPMFLTRQLSPSPFPPPLP